MPRKNESYSEFPWTEEIAQIFEGCICFSKKQTEETKRVIQTEGKGWWPGFILRIQKACLVTKKEGLVRGEVQVPGSSIPENVWTRLKFF